MALHPGKAELRHTGMATGALCAVVDGTSPQHAWRADSSAMQVCVLQQPLHLSISPSIAPNLLLNSVIHLHVSSSPSLPYPQVQFRPQRGLRLGWAAFQWRSPLCSAQGQRHSLPTVRSFLSPPPQICAGTQLLVCVAQVSCGRGQGGKGRGYFGGGRGLVWIGWLGHVVIVMSLVGWFWSQCVGANQV